MITSVEYNMPVKWSKRWRKLFRPRCIEKTSNLEYLGSQGLRLERQDVDNPPFLRPRERDLEYSLTTFIGSVPQQTHEQEQSQFMSLPAELRIAIYEQLFSNHSIHLYYGFWPANWRGGRINDIDDDYYIFWNRGTGNDLPNHWNFFHALCCVVHGYAPKADHWHCVIRHDKPQRNCSYLTREGSHEPYRSNSTIGVMAMLLSCRKVYTEVIHVLYSSNKFSIEAFGDPSIKWRHTWNRKLSFSEFPRLLVPQHFKLISDLDLEWSLAFDEPTDREICFINAEEYDKNWSVLASMPNLQKLNLHLELLELGPPAPISDRLCDTLLNPIDKMRGKRMKEFHIVVCEPYFRVFRRHQNAPYTISFYLPKPWNQDLEPHDDSPWIRGKHDAVYFPRYLPSANEEGSVASPW